MTLRFGTDGVRGVANVELTPELVTALGRAAVRVLGNEEPFVIGRDTRRSGPMLEAALVAGLCAEGADVVLVGVLPTPGVAHAARERGAPAAVISASHNPFGDNGIKLFAPGGRKIPESLEYEVEQELRALAVAQPEPGPDGLGVGVSSEHRGALDDYVATLVDSLQGRQLTGLHVVVDCGNGAAFHAAPKALRALGATVDVIHASPNGVNINAGCGSTHPADLQEAVLVARADAGLAFDGDADRVVAIDERGAVVDGDDILAIVGIDLHDRKLLRGDAVVATVMSNMGLKRALAPYGIGVVETPVGDRNVLDVLEQRNLTLGGEQSGHVIFADHSTTGDGTLTGIFLLDTMARRGRSLSELASVVTRVPQVLRNVSVNGADGLSKDAAFWSRVREIDDELGDDGRVLVRPSGTEPLVRVMVEATDPEAAAAAADRLVDLVEHAGGAFRARPSVEFPLMCGIVGVVRRRSTRPTPVAAALVDDLDRALAAYDVDGALAPRLHDTAAAVEAVDTALHGVPGVRALLGDPQSALLVADRIELLTGRFDALERELDEGLGGGWAASDLEAVNAALVRARDAAWAVGRDRLRTARDVAALAGTEPSVAAIEAFHSVQVALSAIDRLEVRGRDSAGLHLLVRHHGLDLGESAIARLVEARAGDRLFGSGSVRAVDEQLAFVYKAAAEIGELGDNTAVLRAAIRDDSLLHLALANDDAEVMVLGHTRWASVGIISEANAHPLNHEELDGFDRPYVVGALNGDVDNYADLKALEGLQVPAEITTDAKVIPALVARRLEIGASVVDAFRSTVSELAGSMGIAAQSAAAPDRLLLSLRGSGQALYVGLTEDAYVVASEPYGLVEETATYLRMDGETPADPDRASATRGQVVVLDAAQAGTLAGIERLAFDGSALPVGERELQHAEITTRDIDRGDFPHFLLKEISEAPASFRKTLRGKVVERDGRLGVALGADTLPPGIRARLRDGSITRVVVIGQGTAAIAGQSLAAVLSSLADDHLRTEAVVATEFSGFQLRDDMADTLVVAISQSGTTTDTNRTSDLARARGAGVVAIVNRRNSDLVDKADGVLYTSDGRDVEMAVPSTKAFYAQIAAGALLAIAIAEEAASPDPATVDEILVALRSLPDAMTRVLALQPAIAAIAQRHAVSRRYWAVVGNGRNRIAAAEVRVKASELCYKSISFDATEDKKHIDLSAEPLVLVCAAGLQGSNVDDVAKEIAIYRAHRAAPIVITTEGEGRFGAALETIAVPAVHPDVAFVLSAMAGHLFGYEAALAIDTSARPLREVRAAVQAVVARSGVGDDLLEGLAPAIEVPTALFLDGLRGRSYDGHLEAGTAVRIASLLRYATRIVPLDVYQVEHGAVGTPSRVVEDLTGALTAGIEELTRPVDAIKHQAKTVTVGISRSDEELLQVTLAREVLAAGAARDALSYRALRTLVALDPAVEQVVGFTRYRIEGDVDTDDATIHVVDRGGISIDLRSRTDDDPRLVGTKHRVATQREVTVARGRRDQRTVIIVPEVKDNETIGVTLLQARFVPNLPAEVARTVLQGYQGRYGALRDAVTETSPTFDDARLGAIDVVDLLTEPVYVLADRWR